MEKAGAHIFLIGFMGAGKSTVAKELHRMLNVKCLEMDQMIVEALGMPISEVFDRYGEEYFRDAETQTLIDLKGELPAVVSCGGGIVIRKENVAHMKEAGKIVFLTASAETIYERVKDSTERPVLNGNMNVEYISELMEKRRPKYEAAADILIATDDKTVEEICEEIIANVNK